jgi:hypothetical protein
LAALLEAKNAARSSRHAQIWPIRKSRGYGPISSVLDPLGVGAPGGEDRDLQRDAAGGRRKVLTRHAGIGGICCRRVAARMKRRRRAERTDSRDGEKDRQPTLPAVGGSAAGATIIRNLAFLEPGRLQHPGAPTT